MLVNEIKKNWEFDGINYDNTVAQYEYINQDGTKLARFCEGDTIAEIEEI